MAKRGLRTCCVCHTQYQFCPVCRAEDSNLEIWHYAYCSENCKDIYEITSDFEAGKLSASDASTKLKTKDISKLNNFGESYQNSIARIKKECRTDKIQNDVQVQTIIKPNKQDKNNKSIITKADKPQSNVE